MLSCSVIECSTSWMPHRCTFSNFTHWAWPIWDLSNHDVFWIIPDPDHIKTLTLSLQSSSTTPFQARTSYVKIPEGVQHCCNHGMPCVVHIFSTFQGTWNQSYENPDAVFECTADMFMHSTNCELQQPGMLITRSIVQVSLVRCTNEWHNHRSARKPILRILPPLNSVNLSVYLANFRVCEAHQFKIEVCLYWEMCQMELNISKNIPIV